MPMTYHNSQVDVAYFTNVDLYFLIFIVYFNHYGCFMLIQFGVFATLRKALWSSECEYMAFAHVLSNHYPTRFDNASKLS